MRLAIVLLSAFVLFASADTGAEDRLKNAAAETDSRLHADGKGWRLDKAKITDPARPRVLLVGDSILNGYLKPTTALLDGQAYVDAWVNPYCQSAYTNKLLAEVLDQGPYDVVHFNMGLHGWQEGRIKPGTFEPLTKQYVEVIREKLPQAKIIWASSTPVTVKGKPTELAPEINDVILDHNRMAANVMREMHVPVNDFYALLAPKLEWARGDQFHWKPEAYELLAKTTADSVLSALARRQPTQTSTEPGVKPFADGDVVCFIGDSITRGGWFHADIYEFYATRFPSLKLWFYNCGKSGDNAVGTRERLPWDALKHKPNVAVVMLGMNDAAVGPSQDRPIANLEKLVIALKDAGCRVIQVAPTMYDETIDVPAKANIGKNAALTAYTAKVREMAARLGNEFVDFNTPLNRINAEQQKLDPAFTIVGADRVHPGAVGHLVMAYTFLKAQGMPRDVARLVIDAADARVLEQGNCTLEKLDRSGGELSFSCTENALPFVPDERSLGALKLVPFTEELNNETLVVKNLPAGKYELQIDGQPLGEYTAADLAGGINLAANERTPQYQQSLRVLKANARRHDIESIQLRGVALVHASLKKAGIDPQDSAAAEKFLRDFIAAHKDEKGNFGKTMFERYLSSWNKDKPKNLATIEELIGTMRKEAQPVAHQWKLVKKP